jgi:hypothetical protein
VLEQRLSSHPERPRSLNNIAAALTIRFDLYGRGEEAIVLYREALKLKLTGTAPKEWYRNLGNIEDLELAIRRPPTTVLSLSTALLRASIKLMRERASPLRVHP